MTAFTKCATRVSVVLLLLTLHGCMSGIRNYVYLAEETYPPKGEDERIDVYRTDSASIREANISRPYTIIARFEVTGGIREDFVKGAIERARAIGGDALVIQRVHRAAQDRIGLAHDPELPTVFVIRYK